jgi:flagellar hook-basal body complex protein FliE
MTNPIQGLPQPNLDFGSALGTQQQTEGSDFLETFKNAVGQVKNLQSQADTQVAGMLSGDGPGSQQDCVSVSGSIKNPVLSAGR